MMTRTVFRVFIANGDAVYLYFEQVLAHATCLRTHHRSPEAAMPPLVHYNRCFRLRNNHSDPSNTSTKPKMVA